MNWLYTVAGLFLGFLLKIIFDELKSPKLRILAVPSHFQIEPQNKAVDGSLDTSYKAYRIKVENSQKRYLHSAAENCVAWIKLDSAAEDYQICWVGSCTEVTINVGDTREIDICARGKAKGIIVAPTERGYFEPSPRKIGDGTAELKGKIRITSKNGRKAEKNIVIKPSGNNELEIALT